MVTDKNQKKVVPSFLKRSGFTLIEVLLVIVIIGILISIALVSVAGARTKARTAKTISTLSTVRPAITACCSSTSNTLLTTAGAEMCTPAIGSVLPTLNDLQATGVTYVATQCSTANPGYTVTLTGHPNTSCNGAWAANIGALTPPPGCTVGN